MVDSCSTQNNGNATVNLTNGHEKMNVNNHREQPKNNADLKAPAESNSQSPLLSSLLQSKAKESNGNQHVQHVIMGGHDSGSSQDDINVLPQLHHHLTRPQAHNAEKHMLAPAVPNQSDSSSNDVNNKCPITAQLLHKNYHHNLDVLYSLNKHHNNNSNNNSNNSSNSFGVDRLLTAKASTTTKSILENRLLSQSSKLESQPPVQLLAMDEGNFHPSTSALTFSPEMRKVEPLKINLLHREPLRTVIKIPPGTSPTAPNSPKITIKPLAIPKITIKSVLNPQPPTTVSPTSSSSSFTSESSAEMTEIVKVPKLHIKHGGSNHCEPSNEPQTVPKLTIRGVAPTTNNVEAIPKLTIKMDNHDNNFHHLSGANEMVPKMLIKTSTNHHNAPATSVLSKEGVKLKIKMTEQPPQVPKLTIKTSDHEAHFVSSTSNTYSPAAMRVDSPIPKLTIKATNSTTATSKLETVPKLTIKPIFRPEEEPNIPKLNIKPVVKPAEEVPSNNETIPKLTIKAVSNNSNNFEKVVPKLIVKIPPQTPDYSEHTDSSSPSPPIVHKLNIKPIPYPNEMPQDSVPKILIKLPQPEHYNHQKAEKVEKVEKTFHEEIPPQLPPLEVNTSTVKSMDSGQDSPRIILKINKTNKETITSEFIPAPTSTSTNLVTSGSTSVTSSSVEEKPMSITSSFNNHQTHNNKRAAKVTNDDCELPKKLKIATSEVIMINDDTNSGDEASQIKEKNGSRIEASHKNLSGILSKMQKPTESSKPQPEEDEPMEEEQEIFIQKNMLLINEDNEGSSSDCVVVQDDPLNSALSNSLSNDVDLVTPKRGRGRPKKIHTISAVQSEDEVPKSNKVRRGKNIPVKLPNPGTEEKVKEKKSKKEKPEETPENHKVSALKSRGSGRGRGRGRSKRTIEVIKDGKPVKITLDRDDDDDSPSFSIWNRNASGRGARKLRGRGSANRAGNNSGRKGEFTSPAANEPKDGIRRKIFFGEPSTPSMFEDETRMSAGGDPLATPGRQFSDFGNEESQSSMLSSASNTVDGTNKKRAKLEVYDPNGVEMTIDLLAEYDWPQQLPEGASKHTRDTFMIQEQIAEYLGVKSFKRKYPDLMRRTVDMEERNYLYENGLASEKMCDLGLTAVYASEILDIICNDYPDKYEEYKRYQREKQFHLRSRLKAMEPVDKSQLQKDKAIQSASNWNVNFNKDRRENRRCCMDLQNFVVQLPEAKRKTMTVPMPKPSTYPVALVPGQFAESCRDYTPEELACYPLNTVLLDHKKLENYLATHPNPYEFSEESSSDSESGSSSGDSSSSDSDSDTDSEDEDQTTKFCSVCLQSQTYNQYKQPERFVRCSGCKNRAHPSCIEMSARMFQRASEYDWQCAQCKRCCKCQKAKDSNKMLFCQQCDRGYHIYCLGLRNVPEGRWHCDICTICGNCGAKNPEGHPDPSLTQQQRQELSMIANWVHTYQQNPLTKIEEHRTTLCVPCVRLSQKLTTPEKTVNKNAAD